MSTMMHMPVRLKPPSDAGEIISPGCASRSTPPRHGLREETGMPIAVIGSCGIGGPYCASLVLNAAERLIAILGDEAVMGGMSFVTCTIALAWPHRLLLPCEIPQPGGDWHVCGQG